MCGARQSESLGSVCWLFWQARLNQSSIGQVKSSMHVLKCLCTNWLFCFFWVSLEACRLELVKLVLKYVIQSKHSNCPLAICLAVSCSRHGMFTIAPSRAHEKSKRGQKRLPGSLCANVRLSRQVSSLAY